LSANRCPGGFWLRLFGRSLSFVRIADHPPLFSERQGIRKPILRAFGWRVLLLGRRRTMTTPSDSEYWTAARVAALNLAVQLGTPGAEDELIRWAEESERADWERQWDCRERPALLLCGDK
jgi:hypothetical protein